MLGVSPARAAGAQEAPAWAAGQPGGNLRPGAAGRESPAPGSWVRHSGVPWRCAQEAGGPGSSWIPALPAGQAAVLVWARCAPAVAVCLWAHVSVWLQDAAAEAQWEDTVLCDVKAWTNEVLVAGV